MIILTASIRAEEKRFIELTHVCQAETSQSRNSMHPDDEERSENTMDDQADQMPLPKHPHTDSYNLERSRKLFYQATFYVGAFYLTWYVLFISDMDLMYYHDSTHSCMLSIPIWLLKVGSYS